MPKATQLPKLRQCSPLAAAAAGAAVCLSGGSADAIVGNVSASNGGDTVFNANRSGIKLFNGQGGFRISFYATVDHYLSITAGGLYFARAGGYAQHVAAGFNVTSGLDFGGVAKVPGNQSDNYIPAEFLVSGDERYGWVHCVSTNASGSQIVLDTWGYDPTGGDILTLDESITPKKLPLADGRVKLHWSNANEDGVARYEVQAQGADGAWSAVDSDTPGAGSYAATVKGGVEYRLTVENADGSMRSLKF